MSPRLSLSLLAGGLLALSAPAVAQATTYTVDPSAAAGCSSANLCKTVTDANAKVAAGDTITINDGSYSEPAIAVTKANVTIKATNPGKVTISGTGTGGAATFTLGDGMGNGKNVTLSGLIIATGPTGGPAVLVEADGAMLSADDLARIGSTTDMPVLKVDDSGSGFVGGTTTVKGSSILEFPTLSPAGTQPAVLGGTRSSLALTDSLVYSGATSGPAVALAGSDVPSSAPTPNTITRGAVYALQANQPAVTITSASGSAPKKALTIDSALLVAGKQAPGLNVASVAATVPPATAGDIAVLLHHATIAGGAKPFALAAAAQGAGNITVTADHSILHGSGASTVTNTAATTVPVAGNVLVAGNRALLNEGDSDVTDVTAGTADAKTTVTGGQKTADASLFADPANSDFHILPASAAVDKGGPQVSGESTMDFEGEPRVTGAATDLGADEYLNLAPIAAIKVDKPTANTGEIVMADLSGSKDPGAGGKIVGYAYDFGDGSPVVTSSSPMSPHTYTAPGTYTVTGLVADAPGLVGRAQTTITISGPAVAGGAGAPMIAISTPTASSSQPLFKVKRTRKTLPPLKKGGKKRVKTTTTRTLRKIQFTGTTSDATGVSGVELSLKRVSTSGKQLPSKSTKTATLRAASAQCTFFNAPTKLFVGRPCAKGLFFSVAVKADGTWAYTLKGTHFRGGRYELTAQATNTSGAVSNPVTAAFTLTQ